MNLSKLKQLEKEFLHVYPEGFNSERMEEIKKKHKLEKTSTFFKDVCSSDSLESGLDSLDDVIKAVTRSSMVSVFEKVKLKDLIKGFSDDEKFEFLDSIHENLYGNEEEGFTRLVSLLGKYKLAKWPIITVFRAYISMNYDVLVKPTTVKKVIKHLELDLTYSPTPTYKFYNSYRNYINLMKKEVKKSLTDNNPAFSGFLMMTIN